MEYSSLGLDERRRLSLFAELRMRRLALWDRLEDHWMWLGILTQSTTFLPLKFEGEKLEL